VTIVIFTDFSQRQQSQSNNYYFANYFIVISSDSFICNISELSEGGSMLFLQIYLV